MIIAALIPHPDDEIFAAGFLAKSAASGDEVVLVCATRGEQGRLSGQIAAPARVAEVRTAELATSCRVLGIAETRHLDLPDAGLGDEHIPIIVEAVEQIGADALVSYGPRGGYGHSDHVVVARAAAQFGRRRIEMAFRPGLFDDFEKRLKKHRPELFTAELPDEGPHEWTLELDAELAETKREAARAHASQLDPDGVFLSASIEAEIFTRELYRG